MGLRSHACAALLSIATVVAPASASAGVPAVRVVLDTPSSGLREKNTARESVESGVARHGWSLTASDTPDAMVLRVRIRKSSGSHHLRLQLENAAGETVDEAVATCEICGLSELGEVIADRSATLVGQFDADQAAAPLLRITTEPASAEIRVDDERVGVSNAEVELAPGEHVIEVDADGFVRQRRTVRLEQGTRRELQIRLSRAEAPTPTDGTRPGGRALTIAGGTTLALGLGALGAGATLLALDGEPIQRNCNPDPNGQCARLHTTLVGGATSIGLGAAALGTGVALLLVSRKRRQAQPRLDATADGFRLRF